MTLTYETYGELNAARQRRADPARAQRQRARGGYRPAGGHKPGWWDSMIGPGKASTRTASSSSAATSSAVATARPGRRASIRRRASPMGCASPSSPSATWSRSDSARPPGHREAAVRRGRLHGRDAGAGMGRVITPAASGRHPHRDHRPGRARPSPSTKSGGTRSSPTPLWQRGDYYGGSAARAGLVVARMIGHITYLSRGVHAPQVRPPPAGTANNRYDFERRIPLDATLDHQGDHFTDRFDANCFLYITKAILLRPVARPGFPGRGVPRDVTARFLVVSYSSNWLYPSRAIGESTWSAPCCRTALT